MMTNDEIRRMVVENYDPYGQYYLDLYAFVDDLQNAVLEEVAGMVSLYLADHGIDQARESLPDAIRTMKTKEGE
jgi:hypothetical protein